MRKVWKVIMVLFLFSIIIFACKKNFLEVEPLGEFSENAVWSDPNLVETFVNSMYSNNFGNPFGNRKLSDFCDESRSSWSTTYNWNKGLMSSDGLQEWTDGFGAQATASLTWDPLYATVRMENIFFSRISEVPAIAPADEEKIARLKGEVYFNRALTYHLLVSLYGGVPIITDVYGLDADFSAARNTYEECINFIVGQLDSALIFLPPSLPTELQGHATSGAAMALKSRVLLHAASDLHSPSKNESVAAGFAAPELLGYTEDDQTTRWQAAKTAAKAVIDLNLYSLNKENPAPTDNIAQNFIDYFTSYGTPEDILLEFTVPAMIAYAQWGAVQSEPNGYNCWGNQTPLQELVDDYQMNDGTDFDWNNPIHKSSPFENREPRFYATILYEGKKYRKRPPEYAAIDPFDKLQTGRVFSVDGNLLVGGIDTRDGPTNTANGGYTGYYNRKATDTTLDAQFERQDIPFRQFRYAEILLNYAEACIELGEEAEAKTYINKIRHRAGLPDLSASLSGSELKEAYRRERRIELVYENSRFWDIRRWLIAPNVIKQTHSIDIRYAAPDGTTTYRKPDGSDWSAPTYTVIETSGDLRIWDNKYYFLPILRTEINKNNKLIQNPGY